MVARWLYQEAVVAVVDVGMSAGQVSPTRISPNGKSILTLVCLLVSTAIYSSIIRYSYYYLPSSESPDVYRPGSHVNYPGPTRKRTLGSPSISPRNAGPTVRPNTLGKPSEAKISKSARAVSGAVMSRTGMNRTECDGEQTAVRILYCVYPLLVHGCHLNLNSMARGFCRSLWGTAVH